MEIIPNPSSSSSEELSTVTFASLVELTTEGFPDAISLAARSAALS
jgi:hypothetical protein